MDKPMCKSGLLTGGTETEVPLMCEGRAKVYMEL